MTPAIDGVRLYRLPHIVESNGDLVIMEGGTDVPFAIARVFVVRAGDGAVRGCHAHRLCRQFLTCAQGQVIVLCDDGENTARFRLHQPEIGLLIPAGIWASQTYAGAESILTVICDRRYEESDYIRDYDDYITYRREQGA